jgi:hypothetical protein
MKHTNDLFAGLARCLAIAAVALGAWAADPPEARAAQSTGALEVPLEWRPAIELGDLGPVDLGGAAALGIEVRPLADRRPPGAALGEQVASATGDELRRLAASSSEVAAFVTDRLGHLMEEMGLTVVERGGAVVVEGAVRRFFVREEEIYQGEVEVDLALRTAEGERLWQGAVRGGAIRYGLPGQIETYQEALSDALFDMVHRFLTLPEVAAALAEQTARAARG